MLLVLLRSLASSWLQIRRPRGFDPWDHLLGRLQRCRWLLQLLLTRLLLGSECRAIVSLTLGTGVEVEEVREGCNGNPNIGNNDKRRCVYLGRVDVCRRGHRCDRMNGRGRRGDRTAP